MAEKLQFDLEVKKNDLDKALDSANKKSFDLSKTLEIATGTFVGQAAIKGFELLGSAIGSVVGVLGESIQEAINAENEFKRLEVALAQTGQLTDENVNRFLAFSDAIEETTIITGGAVQEAAAYIQTLASLSGDGLERATRAAIDLSAALGIELQQASALVGKAANGNVAALQRYGIVIEKGIDDTQTFANTLSVLESRFSGAAVAQSRTFGGAIIQLGNAVTKSKEELGNLITQNPAVIAAISTLKTVVIQLTTAFSNAFGGDNSNALAEFFRTVIDGAALIGTALDAVVRSFDAAANLILGSVRILALGITAPIAGVLELAASIPKVGDAFKGAADVATAEVNRLSNAVDANAQGFKDAFTKETFIGNAVDGLAEVRAAFDQTFNEIKNKGNELKNNPNPLITTDPADIAKLQEYNAQIADIENQAILERNLQQLQLEIAEREALGERRLSDLESLAEFEQTKLDLQLQATIEKNNSIANEEERRLANEKARRERELAGLRLQGKLQIDTIKQTEAERRQFLNTSLNATQSFIQAGLTLTKQGSKEQKALASANAIVSTYQGAANALADTRPAFLGPIVAAGVIANGLASVARINSQSFATGGIVGATMGGDNITAQVRSGEMVLNADQQKELFEAVRGGSLGGNQPIIIQINGREIARAVREEVQGGFQLA